MLCSSNYNMSEKLYNILHGIKSKVDIDKFQKKMWQDFRVLQWEIMVRDFPSELYKKQYSYHICSNLIMKKPGIIDLDIIWPDLFSEENCVQNDLKNSICKRRVGFVELLKAGILGENHNPYAFNDLLNHFSIQDTHWLLVEDGEFSFYLLLWFLLRILQNTEESSSSLSQGSLFSNPKNASFSLNLFPLTNKNEKKQLSLPDFLVELGLIFLDNKKGEIYKPTQRFNYLRRWMEQKKKISDTNKPIFKKAYDQIKECSNEKRNGKDINSCHKAMHTLANFLHIKAFEYCDSDTLEWPSVFCKVLKWLIKFWETWQNDKDNDKDIDVIMFFCKILEKFYEQLTIAGVDDYNKAEKAIYRLFPAPYLCLEHLLRAFCRNSINLLIVPFGKAKISWLSRSQVPMSLGFITFMVDNKDSGEIINIDNYYNIISMLNSEFTPSLIVEKAFITAMEKQKKACQLFAESLLEIYINNNVPVHINQNGIDNLTDKLPFFFFKKYRAKDGREVDYFDDDYKSDCYTDSFKALYYIEENFNAEPPIGDRAIKVRILEYMLKESVNNLIVKYEGIDKIYLPVKPGMIFVLNLIDFLNAIKENNVDNNLVSKVHFIVDDNGSKIKHTMTISLPNVYEFETAIYVRPKGVGQACNAFRRLITCNTEQFINRIPSQQSQAKALAKRWPLPHEDVVRRGVKLYRLLNPVFDKDNNIIKFYW